LASSKSKIKSLREFIPESASSLNARGKTLIFTSGIVKVKRFGIVHKYLHVIILDTEVMRVFSRPYLTKRDHPAIADKALNPDSREMGSSTVPKDQVS